MRHFLFHHAVCFLVYLTIDSIPHWPCHTVHTWSVVVCVRLVFSHWLLFKYFCSLAFQIYFRCLAREIFAKIKCAVGGGGGKGEEKQRQKQHKANKKKNLECVCIRNIETRIVFTAGGDTTLSPSLSLWFFLPPSLHLTLCLSPPFLLPLLGASSACYFYLFSRTRL